MKKIYSIIISLCLVSCVLPAMAQRQGKFFSVGFGMEGGIPVSDIKNIYSGSFGMTLRFSLHAGPGYATLTSGGIIFFPKNLDNNSEDLKVGAQIPVKAGYKYTIVGPLFVMGELGYSSFRYYYDDGEGNVAHTSKGGFTFAPSLGVQFGVTEFALRYESIRISDGNISTVGLHLGFNF